LAAKPHLNLEPLNPAFTEHTLHMLRSHRILTNRLESICKMTLTLLRAPLVLFSLSPEYPAAPISNVYAPEISLTVFACTILRVLGHVLTVKAVDKY
jgi:hypothetical protein